MRHSELDEAAKLFGQSLESRLALAGMLLDSGDLARSANLARVAAEEMSRQGALGDQARALALTALSAGGRGDAAAARDALGRAGALVHGGQDLLALLTVELAAARVNRSNDRIAIQTAKKEGRAGPGESSPHVN